MTAIVRLLIHLGLQSLLAHKTKSIIVGGLMAFGAFLVTASLALVDSVEAATRNSVVQSVAGDFQVFSKNAKDEFALFGSMSGMGSEDLGEIDNYREVEKVLESVDNVDGVVPVGIANASVTAQGDLDRALATLRNTVSGGVAPDTDNIKGQIATVRRIVDALAEQQVRESEVSGNVSDDAKGIVARARSDELWAEFAREPLATLDWLDSKLAPLGDTGTQWYLRLIGTDLTDFQKTFPKTKIVDGTWVPDGTRGILIGRSMLDFDLKLGVAMHLDMVSRERARGSLIKTTKTVSETLGKAQRASTRLLYLIPPHVVPTISTALAKEVNVPETTPLPELLQAFMQMDDDTFDRRYQLFYDVIAPHVPLYPFKVGDTITLQAFTKSGYVRSMNVKIYGIYAIEGLENDLASALSMTDLVTFRELYGRRTQALDDELKALKAQAGAQEIARDDAEAAMFGGDDEVEVKVIEAKRDDEIVIDKVARETIDTFDQAQVNDGMVISAAVVMRDPSKAMATTLALQKAIEPLGLQALGWQQSTGIIGQMTLVVRAILLTAIAILFLVTIVILNNALVMATLERVAEFGTLRAIGAQRGFVNAMVIFETAVLGAIAGTMGAALGTAFMSYLGSVGIPAPADFLQVLFGGPRLYPTVTAGNIIAGLVATVVVAVFATLYPARLAVSVQPVVAMQGKE